MTNTDIINALLAGDRVQFGGYFYMLDMIGGADWGMFRCPVRSWGYDILEKTFVCSFSLR